MRGFITCLALIAALVLCPGLRAQEQSGDRIPDEVFYLMPEFGDGVIYFRGQNPARGKLNICAVDNTLRFIDDKGQELSAESADNILMVQIDTVKFLHNQDGFYRMYPVNSRTGIALQRNVKILVGAKKGAYGMVDQTGSIRQYSTIYSESGMYNLTRNYPYEVSEEIYLYMGNYVTPLTKKNLKKMFPSRKEDIDAYFKSGNLLPKTVDDALSLITNWAE